MQAPFMDVLKNASFEFQWRGWVERLDRGLAFGSQLPAQLGLSV